ncbi:hypothetical protein C7C46_14310 [Streptomyces tateyamensis]|uniref:Anti-sigma factor antagonist n=1 Tax=Streptomyces tateyamensis TaxID=565073 RepID=A0A2V4N689_9ACTN|nr:STAS domain-containing protein [Streptomyces tateyamensis]PYC79527.1 hypothetical protein C7C46_14310 [Streptomyces tateyamensis]
MALDQHSQRHAQHLLWVPDLHVETARTSAGTVCSFAGDLHADNAQLVRQILDEALDQARGTRVVAVDLSAVALFTSSALNTLLAAHQRARAGRTELVVAAPSERVRRVLEVTGADTVLTVCQTLEQALRRPVPAA